MTDERPVLSPAFVEAMKRVEEVRAPKPVEKKKLLRRSGLIKRDLPETSRGAICLLGALHEKNK